MPEFVLNRDYKLRSLTGHTISFEKGVPINIPQILVKEVVAIGAEATGERPDVLGPEVVAVVQPTGQDRAEAFFTAFEILIERNGRNDFTAQGSPHVKELSKLLGFDTDNKERDAMWQQYRENKAVGA